MAIIYVYNNDSNRIEKYYRGLAEPMPYVNGRTLTVGEFKANSVSNVLWTDKRTMQDWNVFRRGWGRNIYIGYVFKRIWEGGHAPQSQHYAGVALDMAQRATQEERNALRNYAISSGVWTYVEPAYLTPTWVHVDNRAPNPACNAGFPELNQGDRGVYVFILQDALNALGFNGGGLDGDFGPSTKRQVINFQANQGLSQTGVVDCATWTRIAGRANGMGRTPTVVD